MNPLAELRRRLDNLIRPGVIYAVDAANHRCRVKSGELLTDWLRYFVERAGTVRRHSPPTLNEQCVVFSPSGELCAGFVLVGLNSDEFPGPSDNPDLDSATYADGTWFGYDQGSKQMTVIMTAGGKMLLQIPAGIEIQGNVNITGLVTVSEDVIAAGISLANHQTTGVTSGNELSGPPQ